MRSQSAANAPSLPACPEAEPTKQNDPSTGSPDSILALTNRRRPDPVCRLGLEPDPLLILLSPAEAGVFEMSARGDWTTSQWEESAVEVRKCVGVRDDQIGAKSREHAGTVVTRAEFSGCDVQKGANVSAEALWRAVIEMVRHVCNGETRSSQRGGPHERVLPWRGIVSAWVLPLERTDSSMCLA